MKEILLIIFLLTPVFLTGCASVVVGTAATGVAVAHDRRSTGTFVDDQQKEWAIAQAIYADKDIATEVHINVTVYNNALLLSGETPTEDLKVRANAIAVKTGNPKKIFNEIIVAPPSSIVTRSKDSYMTARAKIALLDVQMKNFDLSHIKVVTENSVVYLLGLVTQEEANASTEKVRGVSGVLKVVKLFEYIEKSDIPK